MDSVWQIGRGGGRFQNGDETFTRAKSRKTQYPKFILKEKTLLISAFVMLVFPTGNAGYAMCHSFVN